MRKLLLVLLVSCSHHSDIAPSYSEGGYYSSHIQVNGVDSFGVATVNPNETAIIKLFHRGTISLFSRACNIDKSDRFNGDYSLTVPNCEGRVEFTIMPDKWGQREHNIVELGALEVSKYMTTVRQLREGYLTNGQFHTVDHKSDSGILAVSSTCGVQFEREYDERISYLLLSELYDASIATSGCSFIFRSIPFNEPDTRISKLHINVYAATVVKVDGIQPDKRKLNIPPYILATAIDGKTYIAKKTITIPKNSKYITWITVNGRKAVIRLSQDGNVIWSGQ